MEIAKEKRQTFKDFEKSDYAEGTYFKKYLEKDFSPSTVKVTTLFDGIHIPSTKDWEDLKNEVQMHGLYNAYRLAIAPTQSISYLQNSTPSVLPVIDTIETRTYANSTTYYPMPYLNKDNMFLYKAAYFMDNFKLIDLIACIQEHIDQGISTILYTTNQSTTTDLVKLYLYAHKKGLKSLYYTRTKNLTVEECLSCSV
jgi:ribonucleoside-diphosphate reductase alpha chain